MLHRSIFPWLENHPWLGAIGASVGMTAGSTHDFLDGWSATLTHMGGVVAIGLTCYAQFLTIQKRRREKKHRKQIVSQVFGDE